MKQRGFSTVLLIAIIVLLAGMTSFALQFVASAQGSAALDVKAVQVQQAAEAAIEWQRYRIRTLVPAAAGCVNTNVVLPFSAGNITATVTCYRTPTATTVHTEAGKSVYTYAFTAEACWPAGPTGCPNATPPANYIYRKITASAACVTGPVSCTW